MIAQMLLTVSSYAAACADGAGDVQECLDIIGEESPCRFFLNAREPCASATACAQLYAAQCLKVVMLADNSKACIGDGGAKCIEATTCEQLDGDTCGKPDGFSCIALGDECLSQGSKCEDITEQNSCQTASEGIADKPCFFEESNCATATACEQLVVAQCSDVTMLYDNNAAACVEDGQTCKKATTCEELDEYTCTTVVGIVGCSVSGSLCVTEVNPTKCEHFTEEKSCQTASEGIADKPCFFEESNCATATACEQLVVAQCSDVTMLYDNNAAACVEDGGTCKKATTCEELDENTCTTVDGIVGCSVSGNLCVTEVNPSISTTTAVVSAGVATLFASSLF